MTATCLLLTEAFAASMEKLGPFETRPALAVAVSGGADSMALAVLARDWVRGHNGSLLAFTIDHRLRPASANEARLTIERLVRLGIPARLLQLTNLLGGPALAERARIMRYQTLSEACRDAGLLHLLLGHHAADQAETVAMRVLRGSRTHGLAGMAALRETATVRLLRPLLHIQPAMLRTFLSVHGIDWVEDPSNQDFRALRPRLRRSLAMHDGRQAGLLLAMSAVGWMRAREEAEIATELAVRAKIQPAGFAVLSPGPISAGALSRLVRTIGGAAYPPSPAQLAELAMCPKAATIGGVRLIQTGDGMLIVREEAAIAEPMEMSSADVLWDNRFWVSTERRLTGGATVGKLGDDAACVRRGSDLPSVVLRTLPTIRVGDRLAAIPHISYVDKTIGTGGTVIFRPPAPVAGAIFSPASRA
jgi:tRNA(Ile)-lysidine synthase